MTETRLVAVPDHLTEPLVGPEGPGPVTQVEGLQPSPRLAQSTVILPDGHEVGVSVTGQGIPLVVVHGFSAEGILYAQTLSRLVAMGYRVIAVDSAGHGGTFAIPGGGGDLAGYADLLRRVLDHLGIRRAVLAGHSMGGRLIVELAAETPERVIALLLLDAIVGDTWDQIQQWSRWVPGVLGVIGATLMFDTASTLPVFRDPGQAVKLVRLGLPTAMAHARRPWRLLSPAISILRSGPSHELLEEVAGHGVSTFVLHGDRDYAVPLSTARSAAGLANGQLVVIHGASHSWVLKDPETLPAIVYELLGEGLGAAQRRALLHAGLLPGEATPADVEQAFYERGALVQRLAPAEITSVGGEPAPPTRRSRYRWTVTTP
jgi:pimeloyl-ACP methyl ester carboxylesterase